MALLWTLFAIWLAGVNSGHCTSIDITKELVADSWQSSVYDGSCFTQSASEFGQWSYFHSARDPDPSGYQWLLVKLTRSVRILSVTVQGRRADPSRAEGIEILLSDRLPSGLHRTDSSCQATITHDVSSFVTCGRTEVSRNVDLKHNVKCNYSACVQSTQYILLRKYVAGAVDKYVNFIRLEAIQAPQSNQFFTCEFSAGRLVGCRKDGLKNLVSGNQVSVKICVPCQLGTAQEPKCVERSIDGTDTGIKTINQQQTYFMIEMKSDIRMHGGQLSCSYRCSDGQIMNATETLAFYVAPRNVQLFLNETIEINGKQHWVVGKDAVFTFITEHAFPRSEHTCQLIDGARPNAAVVSGGLEIKPQNQEVRNNTGSGFSISVISQFKLRVNASMEGQWIHCLSQLQGSSAHDFRTEEIASLLYQSSGLILKLRPEQMKANSSATFSITASDAGRPAALHWCSIAGRDLGQPVKHPSASDSSSQWQFVPHADDNGRLISCEVTQSLDGVLVFNQSVSSGPLNVLYAAKNSWSATGPLEKKEGDILDVLVMSTGGNPAPSHHCWIRTSDGSAIKMTGKIDKRDSNFVMRSFSVTSTRQMNRSSVLCRVTQEGQPDMSDDFKQTVTVYYPNKAVPTGFDEQLSSLIAILSAVVLMVLVMTLGVALPVTVYIWRKTGAAGAQNQSGQEAVPMTAVNARDPNTIYYCEEVNRTGQDNGNGMYIDRQSAL